MGIEPERCPRCHGPVVDGRCRGCELDRVQFVHREVVMLGILIAIAVVAYGLTRGAAAANRGMHLSDATTWSRQGEDAQRREDLDGAATAFRRAAAANPDEPHYPLALAAALAASHRHDEAERVLLALREKMPEDPDVNLQLARIEVGRLDAVEARRHYQNALAALWNPSQAGARRQIRVELIGFLLDRGERTRALSELLVLTSEVSGDPVAETTTGQLLLRAGDARRAFDLFAGVLREHPDVQAALAGAGEAAYVLADYGTAERYLARLPLATGRLAELRAVAGLVLTTDALAPKLGAEERRRRLALALTQALHRAEGCQTAGDQALGSGAEPDGGRPAARAFLADLARSHARPVRDGVEEGLELALHLEREAERSCGPGAPLDRAIILIGARHGLEGS